MNIFLEIGKKYNDTDKISDHKYHEIYEDFLKDYYDRKGSILEVGTKNNASMEFYSELFTHAKIFGADLNPTNTISDKFSIFECNQGKSEDLLKLRENLKDSKIFFINDDGSHHPRHQLDTFNILFPILSDDGIYIIEDIETSYWRRGLLYGNQMNFGKGKKSNLIEIFKDAIDFSVNRKFCLKEEIQTVVKNLDEIKYITFAKNCIIIKKQKKNFEKSYRFSNFT